MKPELWRRAAGHGGRELSDRQVSALETYRVWLIEEAVPAGGLGPAEPERLDERHLGDSLLFASPLGTDPKRVIDLGSGVGLPGIPLAILLPETEMILVDRAGKRVDLVKRAVRVLGLDNVEVRRMDIEALEEESTVVVSRATIPPLKLEEHARRLLLPGGVAILGGSWKERPSVPGWESVEIPADVLDRPVWLLKMRIQ